MSEITGTFEERSKTPLLSRIATRLSGRLAVAQAESSAVESALESIDGGRFGDFIVSRSITSSAELTEWLQQNPRHQHSDVLFLDTPPGVEPNLT